MDMTQMSNRSKALGVYKEVIFESLEDCWEEVGECIDNLQRSGKAKADFNAVKNQLNEVYNQHVKEYQNQEGDAILQNQPMGPICTDTSVGFCALCEQMWKFCTNIQ